MSKPPASSSPVVNRLVEAFATPPPADDPPPPDPGWDHHTLGTYVRERLTASREHEDQAITLGRRSAVQAWYAGSALLIVQRRETREKGWVAWCQSNGLTVSTCYEAIRLHQRSGSIENIRNMTITEAREKYATAKGRYTTPKPKPPASPDTATTTPETITTTASPDAIATTPETPTTTPEYPPSTPTSRRYRWTMAPHEESAPLTIRDTLTRVEAILKHEVAEAVGGERSLLDPDHDELLGTIGNAISILESARERIIRANKAPVKRRSRKLATTTANG